MRIGLLTCSEWPGMIEKEQVFADKLNNYYKTDVLIWNDPEIDWSNYQYLIFRTIWDYFEHPEEFIDWMEKIEKLGIKTLNPLEVVKKNFHKFYLKDLESKGIDIVPTIFIPKTQNLDLSAIISNAWEKAVIKPAISGGAYLTRSFVKEEAPAINEEFQKIANNRDLLLQPFLPEIQTEGELSLVFLGGKFAHSILKKPVKDDYRVQLQFGGIYQPYPVTNELIDLAEHIIQTFTTETLLYARVDGVMSNDKFLLMELEVIEPDLYLDFEKNANQKYLDALLNQLK